ncbi:hypothetical protein SPD48_12385 [Pseudogracilibacillus sp. SE30717A]|uniref:hypothetical protein n=1 Tax=Pseudogracilibacillus sp. SE30717A TaxID=3098293 RepID=UPI00300E374A
MKLEWRQLHLPDFGIPKEMPKIPRKVYEERCTKLYENANCKWLAIYGDREHFANLHYLTEFDPRFEEALLVLGPNQKKYLIVGNEGLMYKAVVKPEVEIILCQSFSLMGQDRSKSPRLGEVLKEIGISTGDQVGICGWKYLEQSEEEDFQGVFVPGFILDCFRAIIGEKDGVIDISSLLMHPTKGLRVHNEIEQIAVYEWAATRASAALLRIVNSTKSGLTELDAVSAMKYAGEPLTTYVMYATGKEQIVGLRSPSSKIIEEGDGLFTALGYRGGLSARGGLVAKENKEFLDKWAKPYYRGIVAWYESVSTGVAGGEVYNHICEVMEVGGLRPALNPGHLTSVDEWLHTSFKPDSDEKIVSGMAVQCDIIPEPMPDGIVLNCEDTVFIANEQLRDEFAALYPEAWKRIEARQKFMRDEIGIKLSDDILPFSATPGYYAPLFLSPDHALTVK